MSHLSSAAARKANSHHLTCHWQLYHRQEPIIYHPKTAAERELMSLDYVCSHLAIWSIDGEAGWWEVGTLWDQLSLRDIIYKFTLVIMLYKLHEICTSKLVQYDNIMKYAYHPILVPTSISLPVELPSANNHGDIHPVWLYMNMSLIFKYSIYVYGWRNLRKISQKKNVKKIGLVGFGINELFKSWMLAINQKVTVVNNGIRTKYKLCYKLYNISSFMKYIFKYAHTVRCCTTNVLSDSYNCHPARNL